MKRPEKITFVQNLTNDLNGAKSVVLIDPSYLSVKQQVNLRRRLREAGGKIAVVKNTLLERSLVQTPNYKDQVKELKPSLDGQTAIVMAQEDELAPLQVIGKFIREFELPKLKVGIVGNNVYDSSALLALSHLPGREVLAGQAIGALMGPLYGIAGVLQGKMQELVYILSTKANSGGGETK